MIPFFGVLFKGRKSEGPDNEPRPIAITPDGEAKVILSTATSPVFPGATPPSDISGESLWLHTGVGFEGLYFYDLTRGKWLESSLIKHSWGDDTADNKILSPTGIATAGLGTGYLSPQGMTLVGVSAHARAGDLTKGIEIREDATTILSSFSLVAGSFSDMSLNGDIAGGATKFIDAFAVAAGGTVRDITVDAFFRRSGT